MLGVSLHISEGSTEMLIITVLLAMGAYVFKRKKIKEV